MVTSLLTVALMFTPPVKDREPPPMPAELEKIGDEYNAALGVYYKAEAAARKSGSQPSVATMLRDHPTPRFIKRFREYAEQHGESVEALQGMYLMFNLSNAFIIQDQPNSDVVWAINELKTKYAANPSVWFVLEAAYGSDAPRELVVDLFRTVIRTNKDDETVEAAQLELATLLYRTRWDPKLHDADTKRKEAVELLRALAKKPGNTGIRCAAKRQVFDLDHLQVGFKAPDIEGTDVEGKTIRLSDFRGKVVVLTFWGDVLDMKRRPIAKVPSELSEKFMGKPFAIVGVCSVRGVDRMKKELREQGITWPNIHDPHNKLSLDWTLNGDVYLIDAEGIIRHKGIEELDIAQAVEELLKTMPEKTNAMTRPRSDNDIKKKPDPPAVQQLPSSSQLPLPTLTPSETPVVLMYADSLDRIVKPNDQLTVAVWSDGRIVWREYSSLLHGKMDVSKLEALLQRLHREGVFGDGKAYYGNVGPDSGFETIEVRTADRALKLVSWHDLFEKNAKIVVTSKGVEALDGRSREAVLAEEPKEYVRFRRIWSDIRTTVKSWTPKDGEPYNGPIPIHERG